MRKVVDSIAIRLLVDQLSLVRTAVGVFDNLAAGFAADECVFEAVKQLPVFVYQLDVVFLVLAVNNLLLLFSVQIALE